MLIFLILVLVVSLIAGGIGLAVHALLWLFWVALIIFIVGLVFGLVARVFTSGKNSTNR